MRNQGNISNLLNEGFDEHLYTFNYIYGLYKNVIYFNICKIIPNKHLAQDILQDVFLMLWENLDTLKSDKIENWLLDVSKKKSVICNKQIIQKLNFSELNESNLYSIDDARNLEILHNLKIKIIKSAINSLPKRKKQVFNLCKLQGKSYEEAGLILGICPITVKDHLKISLKYIKQQVLINYTLNDFKFTTLSI